MTMLLVAPVHSAGLQEIRRHLPRAAVNLSPVSRLSASQHLSFAIGLPLRNQDALSNLLQQIYDPASANYHRFLTPEEFTERFGPTSQDYEAVAAFARSNGLSISTRHPNRVLLDVEGSVADIEKALHVRMNNYQHPEEARTFYAPDADPSLDLDVPLAGISGLDNYSLPRPRLVATRMSGQYNTAPNTGSGTNGTFMGKDFRAAYVPGTALTGAGQNVGLLQFDGYTPSDITYYENAAGLPDVPLTNVLLDGFGGGPTGSGGEVEVSLDIEMSISMAPGLSNVIVYMAGPAGNWHDILNRMANDNLAKQLSCSWYIPSGASDPVADGIFQQMAMQGQSFMAASGDSDAYIGLIPFPGDTPYITEVGGTMLTTSGPASNWLSEAVWNRNNGIGSGGGISTQYPIPSWQTNVSMAANQGSTTMRNTPDVALTAESVYVRADGLDYDVGGTSCASPLWAGFTALVNQQAANVGQPPVGFLNPAVYAIGAATNYTSVFHDITTGNNTSSTSPTKFYATPGYDLCTGWGSPAGSKLIDALAPPILVTLPVSATEGDGLLPGAGHVQLPSARTNDVVVGLSSGDPAQVSVPASVTVPAGQTNGAFDLTILDDGVLDGTQSATITASAPGIGNGSASMIIFDKETTTLQVSLPAVLTKGQGSVQGTVQSGAPVAANVTVALSSDTTNLISTPATVVIPAGQSSAMFTAAVLTDGLIDGGQTVHVTAHEQNWTDGTEAVTVQDNVNLTVNLPASAWKNAGVLTNAGSVSLAGTPSVAEVISLVSSNPSKMSVPPTVTIPAGSLSNTFNLTMIDNTIADGHQYVSVTASAPGFTNGSASVFVLDENSPLPPFNPRPPNLATNIAPMTNLTWVNTSNAGSGELVLNGGFESGSLTNWTVVRGTYGGFVINNGTVDPPSPDGPLPPFAGSYDALGDESGPGIFYMYQTVSIPANAVSANFSWAHRVRNFYTSFSSTQEFQVRICDTNNNVLATAFSSEPGDPLLGNWVQTNYDLTSFAGQTVRLMFWVNSESYYIDAHVDNVSLLVGTSSTNLVTITNDVYFGTDPAPGPADYQGSTTNSSWALPLLAPLTTYYWQIVAHHIGSATSPVWQFSTAGVDHFAWSTIYSPQLVNQPFSATITAQDLLGRTVSNFTGAVSLQCGGSGTAAQVIEGFESGIWPHAPWVSVAGVTLGTISTAYAHDGLYGLSDPDWIYRTDVSIGNPGDVLSWWMRPGSGRSYLGFGASASGCWSAVAAPNTSQFILYQDAGYGFTTIASNAQTWQAGKWYKVAVQFGPASSVTCNLYDSDGVTLLNSLSYTGVTGLPGGIAMRSFGGFSLDTISLSGISESSVPISPTNSGNFANGAWSGSITVQQPVTNVVLYANDGANHTGTSTPFDVDLMNDISINGTALPNPAYAGSNLVFTLAVANTGPSAATGVTVTNLLPANVAFVSAVSSQGTCTQSGGVVSCSLGVIAGGTNATISITVVPAAPGATLTNVATVTRAETDAYLGNNTVTTTVSVAPGVSIADVSALEGNVGTTNFLFTVSLNAPSTKTISVNYATADGTAFAGKDYYATNGILAFPPGTTNGSINVAVIGNVLIEPNKTFTVNLSNPINASVSRAQAVGTIINDDGLPGQVYSINWNAISSPQLVGSPFTVAITALDASNNPATNFIGNMTLTGTGGHGAISFSPTTVGPFVAGQWTGALTVNTLDTNVVLTATDGNGHYGNSNPFNLFGAGSTFIAAASRVDMVQDSTRGLLYITDGNQVLRYNLNSETFLAPYVFGTNLCGIDISPDNNTLVVADTAAYNNTNVWVYVVDLPSGAVRQADFPRAAYEGGTYAVAFGNDGAAVITSTFLGSGWVPMRRYDPVSGNMTVVANPRHDSMVSASGDGRIIGVAEADISNGPLDRYNVASQTITGSVDDGWFNFEVGVNRNGSQFAVPTYYGTFIYDTNLQQTGLLGTYATEGPIGLAYDAEADLAFFAWWPTSGLRVYETHTWAEVANYDCGYSFQWTGNGAFGQGRVRASRDGNNLFVTVGGGVQWISRPVSPPADLALSLTGSSNPVNAGNNLTYTITVTNNGPNAVTDAKVYDRLPANVTFVSAASPQQGTCTQSGGLVTCSFNPIANGASATVVIVVVPTAQGTLVNTAAVCSSSTDANPDNNAATLSTTVQGVASLAVTPATGFSSSGHAGGPFSPASQDYLLTNNGTASLNWTAANQSNWVTLSASSGTLAPGTTTTVTVSIGLAADLLPAGSYTDTVTFNNLTSGIGSTTRGVSLTVNPPPSCTPPATGLAGWWAAEGNANDSFGTNNGTLVGSAGFAAGEVGQAFSFDGLSQYVDVPTSASLNPTESITCEAWIYQNQLLATAPIIKKAGEGLAQQDGYSLEYADPAHVVFWVCVNGTWVGSSQAPVSAGQWCHVAGVFDGLYIYVYVNGTLSGSPVYAPGVISPSGNDLQIGHDPANPSRYFGGLIDEASVYDTALSATQIQAIYTASSAGKCAEPPAIVTEPVNQTVTSGTTAVFSVAADGSQPLNYQWKMNGTNVSTAANPTASNAVLVLANVQLAQSGNHYSVVVSNREGSTNSTAALLTVLAPICDPPPLGLVSWWAAEGNANDSFGTNNGIAQGNLAYVPGEAGQAWQFDGSSAAVRVPAASSLDVGTSGGLTIEGWIKPASLNVNEPVALWDNGTDNLGAHFWINQPPIWGGSGPGSLFSTISDTSGVAHNIASPANILSTNSWNHVALTYDKASGTAAFYLNGTAVVVQQLGVFTPLTSYDFYLGYAPPSPSFSVGYFTGLMDEFSLYNTALSSNQIQAIYDAGSAGKCPPQTPPTITSQPTNEAAVQGATAMFSVGATSTEPLNYQWRLNQSNILAAVNATATNATLVLTNVQAAGAGSYSVVVANQLGTTNSSNAMLTVLLPPKITLRPRNQLVQVGCAAAFNSAATGTGILTYQWQKNGTNLPGQNGTNLTLPSVQPSDFGNYTMIAGNNYGSATSTVAVLALDHLPVPGTTIVQRFAGAGVRINISDILVKAFDADGDRLSIVSAATNSVAGGAVTLVGPSIYYMPPSGLAGADSFTYTISDGHCDGTSVGTVLVNVRSDTNPASRVAMFQAGDGSVQVFFDGMPGLTYRVQCTASLTPPNWQDVASMVADPHGTCIYVDWPATNGPVRYFRSVTP
jgi:uncharacterized repeat protein (TIGR01451 family)